MDKVGSITAKITGIEYTPFLCRKLQSFKLEELQKAISKKIATFLLETSNKKEIALSWWRSAKRTRSYPYARVYDSLAFTGKKVTIIPVFKDEGIEGDRDFLQWDTISLMSLLDVYVIVAYYSDAIKSSKYERKITEQRFDTSYLNEQIKKFLSYQSSALHWNVAQIDNIWEIGEKALDSYEKISKKLSIEMHSKQSAEKRIGELKKGKDTFMALSRGLAKLAQKRESITIQPKEYLEGTKGIITITNYLGGNYYFTSDEVELHDDNIWLVDAKHTEKDDLPSLLDIKDGLLKMILFTNLKEVKIDGKNLNSIPILKLTTGNNFSFEKLNDGQKKLLEVLKKEAKVNRFRVLINKAFIF